MAALKYWGASTTINFPVSYDLSIRIHKKLINLCHEELVEINDVWCLLQGMRGMVLDLVIQEPDVWNGWFTTVDYI